MAVLDTNFQTIELGDVAWFSKLNANFQYLNHYELITAAAYSCDTANASLKDYILGVDTTSAAVTISLPKLLDNSVTGGGRIIHILKIKGSSNVTIQTDSTATSRDSFNGGTTTTEVLTAVGGRCTVVSAGSAKGWFGVHADN
mgnify:CR=1 FL=1